MSSDGKPTKSESTEVIEAEKGWDVDFSSDVKKWHELNGGEKVVAFSSSCSLR